MDIDEFVAVFPYDPEDTKKELEGFIPRFKGMVDWEIHSDGSVVIQYDPDRISADLIEEVLERNGFRIEHITHLTAASELQAYQAFHWQDENSCD